MAKTESPEPDTALMSAEGLTDILRGRIQKSELLPDAWLREAKLCGEFGIGRSTVRRALRALAEDGLVDLEENRGARVRETTVEEVFDLYEVRAALYGLAARFACQRASQVAIQEMLGKIDRLLDAAEKRAPADEIIAISEAIFSAMAQTASPDAQRMIESVRRKTRWHYSYVALAVNAAGPEPYEQWRHVRAALVSRNADRASEAARKILYFMQSEVARIMLARGPGLREERPAPATARASGTRS